MIKHKTVKRLCNHNEMNQSTTKKDKGKQKIRSVFSYVTKLGTLIHGLFEAIF